jgi:hypothetical protein
VTEPARGEPEAPDRSGGGAGDAAGSAVFLLLVLGVGWRLLRYAQNFALSDDESFVVLNLMDGDWTSVFKPTRAQVVPALFLWAEKAALWVFGPSEYGLRLLPLAAGLLGLVLFWRLAHRALSPQAAALATGILSVSYFPVRFSSEIKSYSFDLLAAVVLLQLGLHVREDPGRLRPLRLLVFLAPLLVLVSYPSCLLVASVSAVLLPAVWRHPDRRAKALFVAYNVAALAVFLVAYLRVGVGQFQGQGGFSNEYWQLHQAFPPAGPWALLVWLFQLATGLVFAYPLGDVAGAAALTFLLSVAGAATLRRSGRPGVLAICLLPFAATFAVAAARLYPFGPHPRVAQHLAAPICLLAGAGVAALVEARNASPAVAHRRTRRVMAFFAVVGLAGVALDLLQPYRSRRDEAFRTLAAELRSKAGRDDLVAYVQDPEDGRPWPPPLEFYLRKVRLRVSWTDLPDLEASPRPRQVWVIAYRLTAPPEVLKKRLESARPPFAMLSEVPYALRMGTGWTEPIPCSVSHWRRPS